MQRKLPWIALAVLIVAGALAYYIWQAARQPATAPTAAPEQTPAPLPAVTATPAKHYPIELAPTPTVALPPLEASDATIGEALLQLLGGKSLPSFLYAKSLIRRIVATIDNLPRRNAPRRMMPFKPVEGSFAVARSDGEMAIDPGNYSRYEGYVRVLRGVDASKLVDLYARLYPLFQQAYSELGYPKGHFNDRLVEALDDLLAAPDVPAPVRILQPKVLYEYADPELEGRSAGQRILIRMGSSNEAQVKLALKAIRSELMRRISVK